MNILIPVDLADMEEGKITLFKDTNKWLSIEHSDGRVQKHKFYNTKEEVEEFIELLIIKNDTENIQEFLDEGIPVLMAPLQMYIEDVLEAYLFKELYDVL